MARIASETEIVGAGSVIRECMQCDRLFRTYPSQIKRGGGKFCSISCGTTYRNLVNNPTKCPEVRKKISENHSPVPWLKKYSGNGYRGVNVKGYRLKAFRHYGRSCNRCGDVDELEVHHKDRNRENNDLVNLEVLCRECHLDEHKEELAFMANKLRCPETGKFMKGSDVIV